MTVDFLPEHLAQMRMPSAVQSVVDKKDGLRILMQLAAKGLCVTVLPTPDGPPVCVLAAIPIADDAVEVLILPSTAVARHSKTLVKACRRGLGLLMGRYNRVCALADPDECAQRFLRHMGFIPSQNNTKGRDMWEYRGDVCGG